MKQQVSVLMALLLAFQPLVFAQELNSEMEMYLGIKPDSPFYFMEQLREQIQSIFKGNDPEWQMYLAQKRLAEAEYLLMKNETEKVQRFLEKYQKRMEKLNQIMEKCKTKSDDKCEKGMQKVKEEMQKQERMLKQIQEHLEDCEDCEQLKEQIREMKQEHERMKEEAEQIREQIKEMKQEIINQTNNHIGRRW